MHGLHPLHGLLGRAKDPARGAVRRGRPGSVDAGRIHADDVAERAVTIGVTPEAAPPPWPRVIAAIAETEKTDVVSQDLLIGITAALEKHLWMFRAEC